jgi:hypothetical protein
MKKTLIAAAIAFMSATTAVSADPFFSPLTDPNVLVNRPIVEAVDELACFGCISPSTGRIRDGYVTPHFRSNGSFVNGYWRS